MNRNNKNYVFYNPSLESFEQCRCNANSQLTKNYTELTVLQPVSWDEPWQESWPNRKWTGFESNQRIFSNFEPTKPIHNWNRNKNCSVQNEYNLYSQFTKMYIEFKIVGSVWNSIRRYSAVQGMIAWKLCTKLFHLSSFWNCSKEIRAYEIWLHHFTPSFWLYNFSSKSNQQLVEWNAHNEPNPKHGMTQP